eukprot:CAMPEP_0118946910 /NCGR_PEP_ID=MMETSP1169-20130426/45078_1 /TAXON_ID=36882 /ORGANISM="Pyramimonas obovata, Strain CCMP722" /LENGTH=501 /DNA_ID=CAMNT_0006893011 /DNA_START=505 /DNA_END=2007 /DNA_ORIENTATION=+
MSVASPRASAPAGGSVRDKKEPNPKDELTKQLNGSEREKSAIPIQKVADGGRKVKAAAKNGDFDANEDDGDSSGAETWEDAEEDEENDEGGKTGEVGEVRSASCSSPAPDVKAEAGGYYGQTELKHHEVAAAVVAAGACHTKDQARAHLESVLQEGREKKKQARPARSASDITREELAACFHLPSEAACRQLGIGLTVLKRQCRKFGIKRWPFRKIKSLDRLISNVQAGISPGDQNRTLIKSVEELEEQKRKMENLVTLDLDDQTKRLQQAYSKANHKARRLTGAAISSAFSADNPGVMAAAHSAGLYPAHCLQGMPATSSANGYGLFPAHYPYGFIPPYLLTAAAATSLAPPIGSLIGGQAGGGLRPSTTRTPAGTPMLLPRSPAGLFPQGVLPPHLAVAHLAAVQQQHAQGGDALKELVHLQSQLEASHQAAVSEAGGDKAAAAAAAAAMHPLGFLAIPGLQAVAVAQHAEAARLAAGRAAEASAAHTSEAASDEEEEE